VLTQYCSVAPLQGLNVTGHLNLPYKLANDITFEYKPDSFNDSVLYKFQAKNLKENDPDWNGKNPRSVLDRAHEILQLINLSVWLAFPCSINYSIIVTFKILKNTWNWENLSSLPNSLYAHKKYARNRLRQENIERAKILLNGLMHIPRPSAIWVAGYSLWTSLTERTFEVRYLFLWIALEALFGPEDHREITFRLSQRIAFFLKNDKDKTFNIYEEIKNGYKWRSKLVHGMKFSKSDNSKLDEILFFSENLVRQSLVHILMNQKLINIFASRKREEYLDSLIFSK